MIFLYSILATYAVSLITSKYDGPYDIFVKMREKWLKKYKAFGCFVCSSMYVSLAVSLMNYTNLKDFILIWLATCGGAVFIYKITEEWGL